VTLSAKISRAKEPVRSSRYRAAQDAAPEEIGFIQTETKLCSPARIFPRIALLALSFVLVLVVVLVLEKVSNPIQSWIVGMTVKKPALDEAGGTKRMHQVRLIPLRFEDDHDDEGR
jgi:hypothetical protein